MRDFPSKEEMAIWFIVCCFFSVAVINRVTDDPFHYFDQFEKRRLFIALNSLLFAIVLMWKWMLKSPETENEEAEARLTGADMYIFFLKKFAKFIMFSALISLGAAIFMSGIRESFW
jgi:hypothetical protein